jgi:hypothetical protein
MGGATRIGRIVHAVRGSECRETSSPAATRVVVRHKAARCPVFNHEPSYANIKLPDVGYQLLALFRFWNMIEYWFPYRDVIGENWDSVLNEFIPRIGLARTREAYQLETMALIARVNDTHANLWSSLNVRPPVGTCQVPVQLRFIGNRVVVSHYANGHKGELKPGDAIESVDGVPVPELVARWAPTMRHRTNRRACETSRARCSGASALMPFCT